MQAYSPRDPVAEYLDGRIGFYELEVLVRYLPEDSPWYRERSHPWTVTQRLLVQIESRLRDLQVQQANLWRPKGTPEVHVTYLPEPGAGRVPEKDPTIERQEQAELEARILPGRG